MENKMFSILKFAKLFKKNSQLHQDSKQEVSQSTEVEEGCHQENVHFKRLIIGDNDDGNLVSYPKPSVHLRIICGKHKNKS